MMTRAVATVVVALGLTAYVNGARATAGFELVDVTTAARLTFSHYTGAFGKKYLPETLGSGVAVFDADGDGRQDVLFVNGTSWPSQTAPAGTTMKLFRNGGDGSFEDVTARSGLALPLYGMAAAGSLVLAAALIVLTLVQLRVANTEKAEAGKR